MVGEELLMQPLATTLLFGVVTLLFFYWYLTKEFNYWKITGIPYAKPAIPIIGTAYERFWKPLHEIDLENYRKLGPVYGQFDGNRPVIAVADPKLLREILVKEFQSFTDRKGVKKIATGGRIEDFMLFALPGEEWKRVRNIITPIFTTAKIKKMVNIMKECGQVMIDNIKTVGKSGKPVTTISIYEAFSCDIFAAVGYSLKCDSYNDTQNEFVQSVKQATTADFIVKFGAALLFPRFAKLVGKQVFNGGKIDFLKSVILQMMKHRIKTNETEDDTLQFLMSRTKDYTEDQKADFDNDKDDITSNYEDTESLHQVIKNSTNRKLSLDEALAQSIALLISGLPPVSTTLSLVSYLLALNPEIQEKTFEEMREVLQKTEGELTYEAIQEMKYLDNVLLEAFRLYPVIRRLERTTVADCKLGNTGLTVPKGMMVRIPIYALHRDPELFPDPEKFDPDRFLPEERAKRDPFTYMPFGRGPRMCFAVRFAMTEIKTSLVCVLATFKIQKCSETKVPLEFNLGLGPMTPKCLVLKYEERTDKIMLK